MQGRATMQRKQGWFWITITLLLTMGVAALWRGFPRDQPLLQRATRITDTTAWEKGGRCNLHWLSDHELLYSKYEGPEHNACALYRLDLQTGQETKLPGLAGSRNDFVTTPANEEV